MTTAASRKRRSREREAAGLVCLQIEVDRAQLVATLEAVGLLNPMHEETRASLAAGVEELLKIVAAARDAMPGENVIQ